MNGYLVFAILAGVVAIAFAFFLSGSISKENAGNEKMTEIAGHIHDGAMAFLKTEYRYLTAFIVIVSAVLAIFFKLANRSMLYIWSSIFYFCWIFWNECGN